MLVLALAAVLAAGAPAAAQAAPAPVAKSLRTALKQLKARTKLPIVLPSVLPVSPLEGRPSLYPVVTASARRWDVVLGYVPGCNGANVCAAGTLSGVRSARRLGSGDGRKVTLRGGVEGRFRPLTCGANCAAPSITFKRYGLIFSYQLKLDGKGGDATDRIGLVRVANSALAGGLR
ncbi:MAG: hypothetical protein JWP18_828 [Solirubrobacterales bacterium]|nr:hypothetical protein [Solirubrobacterales bacterium]